MPLFSFSPPSDDEPFSRQSVLAAIRAHHGIIPVANASASLAVLGQLAAQDPPIVPSPQTPIFFWRQDTGDIECTPGGGTFWVYSRSTAPFRVATGWTFLTFNQSITTSVDVALPPGRFTKPPGVVASITTPANNLTLAITDETAVGFRINGTAPNPAYVDIGIRWIAIQE